MRSSTGQWDSNRYGKVRAISPAKTWTNLRVTSWDTRGQRFSASAVAITATTRPDSTRMEIRLLGLISAAGRASRAPSLQGDFPAAHPFAPPKAVASGGGPCSLTILPALVCRPTSPLGPLVSSHRPIDALTFKAWQTVTPWGRNKPVGELGSSRLVPDEPEQLMGPFHEPVFARMGGLG